MIGLNEVALGLMFPPKIARIVRARVPPRSIHEVVLRGALHAPAEAFRLGLVDQVTADPHAAARAWLEEVAGRPRGAYAAAKQLLRGGVVTMTDAEQPSFAR